MKLLTDNQADLATVSCDDASVNYPASNVQDSRLSRIFRGDESIEFDITGSGGLKNISQEYTNLVQDPCDLTTANWTQSTNITVSDSGEAINGEILWKVETDVDGTYKSLNNTSIVTTSTDYILNIILRKSDKDYTWLSLRNTTAGTDIGTIKITFSTKQVSTVDTYDSLKYTWIDDDTIQIYMKADSSSIVIGNSIAIYFRLTFYVSESGSILVSQPQITEGTTMFPFVDGTHSADVITETFTMPDRFTFDMIIEPKFAYDTSISNKLLTWYVDATHELTLRWNVNQDKISIQWQDAGNEYYMYSQQFDDGTTYIDVNQRIRIIGSMDLISGGQNDSRFIIIPLESGALSEDTSWNGTPDIKSSDFPTLYIGYDGTDDQADSEYEYLRIYEGLLVGDVTSSDDVTELLKDKKILLDKTYQQKLTATDLLIAGSTINDGDSITLVGNDLDSYGEGSPVYEDVTWSKDIITHSFTKASHQYWRLIVNSSNTIDIGRLYLGSSFTTASISPVVGHSRSSNSIKSISVSGNSYMDARYFSSTISIKWSAMTTSEKEDLISQFESVDIGKPFFITFDESNISLGTVYCTIDQEGLNFNLLANPEYWEAALSIMEEV